MSHWGTAKEQDTLNTNEHWIKDTRLGAFGFNPCFVLTELPKGQTFNLPGLFKTPQKTLNIVACY